MIIDQARWDILWDKYFNQSEGEEEMKDIVCEKKIRVSLEIEEVGKMLQEYTICKSIEIDGQQIAFVMQLKDYRLKNCEHDDN